MFKRISAVLLSLVLIISSVGLVANASDNQFKDIHGSQVDNVIFMIPDGFSPDYASNYRVYKGEEAVWDAHVKGLFTTYSANSDVTDSAAAATAMATGVKTNNGMIGFDPEGNKLKTILQASKEAGKSTGLVATSTITHATPAGFSVSVENRSEETEIARQYIQDGNIDVILGGGRNNFLPESEGGKQKELNLIEEAKDKGFKYVETRDQLANAKRIWLNRGEKLLGLFAEEALAPELHRGETEEPSLAEMTETAINILSQDKDGFFLLVEGSQIDWAGHDNDAAYAMKDTEAFEEAVRVAFEFAEKNKRTLVVIGGDHDTGGMTTGSSGSMSLDADILKNVIATGEYMAAQLNEDRSNVREVIAEYARIDLTDEEVDRIQGASDVKLAINHVISDRAHVGWTSTNHTGADITVYAYGPQAYKFVGFLDNTDLPKIIAEIIQVDLNN